MLCSSVWELFELVFFKHALTPKRNGIITHKNMREFEPVIFKDKFPHLVVCNNPQR